MINQALSSQETENIWQQVCDELKPQLTPAVYNTWVLNNPLTELTYLDNNKAQGVISAQSAFHATNLKKQLFTQLKSSVERITGKNVDLQFRIQAYPTVKQKKQTRNKKRGFSQAVQSQHTQHNKSTSSNLSHANIHSTQDLNTNNKQNISPTVEELFSTQNIAIAAKDRAKVAARRIGLRMDYTFESFAVSTSNEMAHAAALAVSKRPGSAYNPLFLYGNVGVGKTHLMHAIGHNILKENPDTNIIYCTSEEFTNAIIQAIQTKKALNFKEKYRQAQVFFIDDIQFIAGKNTVQEEFFHTFNALIQKGSQIILTSDRPPQDINLLEDRLKSRFEAGLMIDIQQPSNELRAAIVLIKSRANHLVLPMELAQLIANQVDSARRIEGIITQIRSEVELKRRNISEQLIEEILTKEKQQNGKTKILRIKPSELIKKVAQYYQLKSVEVKGKKRLKEIVKARHIAMFLLKQDVQLSFVEIGKWFSNRDHTSVMHAVKKIKKLLDKNSIIVDDINQIRRTLK